ncbi:hypothetical protein GA640_06850 [Bifidobacterium adolescentis]|uniref:Uncharacterized protein n=1 Tax=Bifidobacterium adolescentis TaxID=1680 RepID=A0A6A2R9Q3_BIFAD|nr:hypothetical protein GA673_06780 [Bifidobacterium adolescentis]KAB5824272.1 hypothetical protein GA670_05215 [Bifidobacterium adolescentis]KAB5827547.1 hypothetical protein GA661_06550 [Bifidobacterium adolescentis]KAB5829069.1 hypothetical protein GA669_08980 [Bifidobacterium adolescentis]KAB5829777.1 hypothetical protein GA665_06560 [Bifidobacterium adolescentis]
MEIEEINEPTRNWTVDEFADFLHYRLQHGDRESIRSWWRSTSLLRKLEATGLAGLDGDEVALTPAGIELRDALYLLEESDGLADARLNLRVHRLEDWHAAPLGADTLMLLVAGRSGRARVDAARMLMEDVDGGREYADRLAKCWDPKVRILAAPYADPHLFLDETDPDVVGAVIKGGLADDVCRERWTSPDKPFGVRFAAGALVADGEQADRMLATMTGYERIRFLSGYPRLAVGERAANACRTAGDDGAPLEYSMTRVPDDYLREALESKSYHWGLKSRVEDYRQALREAMRLERLFAGPDSQVLAEIRGQVEAEITEEEER